jgi:hypothetical protein
MLWPGVDLPICTVDVAEVPRRTRLDQLTTTSPSDHACLDHRSDPSSPSAVSVSIAALFGRELGHFLGGVGKAMPQCRSWVGRPGSVIPPIAVESNEEDTGQWGRSVDLGSWAQPISPDSGLSLARQRDKESEEGSKEERRRSEPATGELIAGHGESAEGIRQASRPRGVPRR